MSSTAAEKARSRSKLTKALVATGVGVALLAGGGGTFATWYASTTTTGPTITSGDLGLTASGVGTWHIGDALIADIANYRVVPGETLTFTQSVKIDATGNQLQAVLKPSFPEPTLGGDNELSKQLRASALFVVDGTKVDPASGLNITSEHDGEMLDVTLEVTFPDLGPRENGTTAQEQSVKLQDITIELEQTALAPSADAAP